MNPYIIERLGHALLFLVCAYVTLLIVVPFLIGLLRASLGGVHRLQARMKKQYEHDKSVKGLIIRTYIDALDVAVGIAWTLFTIVAVFSVLSFYTLVIR